ncbi:ATP-binding cassette domain-containing protein, partial [Acinetobacter baumannii]
MSLAIAAAGLDVGYSSLRGPVKVIAGLDLTVETGTFLSILGPSGCGKSTLLR